VLLSVLISSHTDGPQVSRHETGETGRRRRWSEAEKLRIVEESLSGCRMVSATGPREDRVEIVLVSGRRLLVDPAIEPSTLIRLAQVLERA
jgi:hypothetical protein